MKLDSPAYVPQEERMIVQQSAQSLVLGVPTETALSEIVWP